MKRLLYEVLIFLITMTISSYFKEFVLHAYMHGILKKTHRPMELILLLLSFCKHIIMMVSKIYKKKNINY